MAEQVKTDRAAIEARREDIALTIRVFTEKYDVPNWERIRDYATAALLDQLAPLPPEPRSVTFTTRYGSTVTLTERRHGYDVAFAGSGIRSTVGTLLDALTSSAPRDTDLPRLVNTFLGTPAPERFESVKLFTNRYESGYSRNVRDSATEARKDAANDALETGIELYRKVAS